VNCGILGGTFNPVHVAHLRLAEAAREALGLARVCFVPACVPPLKTEGLASAEDRLEMVRLATASNAGFEVLDLELRRAGPSYSVDTLEALRSQYPRDSFWFLIGSDALRELELWQRPDELLKLTSLGVICRPGSEAPLEELLPSRFRAQFHAGARGLEHDSGNELRTIPFPALEISASEIRQRRASGHSIRYLVPDAVLDYIEKHGLYREEA
jgi:nicotinate-nucleotide adenylyltransferase